MEKGEAAKADPHNPKPYILHPCLHPTDQLAILNDKHSNWPFLQGTIDLNEIMMVKTQSCSP